MIIGLLVIMVSSFRRLPLSIVGIETPLGSAKIEGISERSAMSLFTGFVLIIIGGILRFKNLGRWHHENPITLDFVQSLITLKG